ncbi:unnamed protein product [Lactuca virosa]|uniref:Uncharacterized protein n=1 Tax=Lactuca virosa TaxID=75947 RepID=A0AAU9LUG6_9ASTR|nr:unnamed protein product [Lactuca virosa]
MEITELNLIGDFEAGMKCLQNPSLLSTVSLIDKVPRFYSYWTWGALILAVFATFTSIFGDDDLDFDFSDDDGDDDTPSSVAESDDEELDSEDGHPDEVFRAEGSSFWGNNRGSDGNFTLRRRNGFSLSDFSAGKSVVQLWDSFGLGLDFEDDESEYGSEIAIWDLDRDVKLSSGRRCEVAAVADNVVLTAEMNDNNGEVGFRTYDSRVDGKSPAIYATWRSRHRQLWADDESVTGQKEE